MDHMYTLVGRPLRFYTQTDEAYCFKWIKKIKSVVGVEGVGQELHLILKSINISKKDLLELVGIFRRYNFDLESLKIFLKDDNRVIFEALFPEFKK